MKHYGDYKFNVVKSEGLKLIAQSQDPGVLLEDGDFIFIVSSDSDGDNVKINPIGVSDGSREKGLFNSVIEDLTKERPETADWIKMVSLSLKTPIPEVLYGEAKVQGAEITILLRGMEGASEDVMRGEVDLTLTLIPSDDEYETQEISGQEDDLEDFL